MDQSTFKTKITHCSKNGAMSGENEPQSSPQNVIIQNNLFECTVCQENFTNENELTKHYRDHMEKNLFLCVSDEDCEMSETLLFDTQQNMPQISNDVNQIVSYECDICHEIFLKKGSLRKHYSVHAETILIDPEEECEMSVDEPAFSLDIQQNNQCDVSTNMNQISHYKCDICNKIFSHESSLTRHYYTVHSEIIKSDSDEEYETSVAVQSFTHNMQQNIKCGTSVGQISGYPCDICHKIFSHKSSLTRHYPVHGEINLIGSGIEGKKYECCYCGKSFLLDKQLRRHHRCHVKSHECDVCHKTFPFKSNLITHYQTHLINLHKCPICFNSFDCERDLKYHTMTHKEIQPLYSLIQNNVQPFYSLIQNSNSDASLSTETVQTSLLKDKSDSDSNDNADDTAIQTSPPEGKSNSDLNSIDKLLHCDRCDKSFDTSRKLSIHCATHERAKRHTCIVCLKSFSKISHLQCHLRIHTGEKPFSCNVCDRAFSEKGNLIKHELRHQRDSLRNAAS